MDYEHKAKPKTCRFSRNYSNVENAFVFHIRYLLLKLEITTSELIVRVWNSTFLPRLHAQSKWAEISLGDRFQLN